MDAYCSNMMLLFGILIGIATTLAVQYLLSSRRDEGTHQVGPVDGTLGSTTKTSVSPSLLLPSAGIPISHSQGGGLLSSIMTQLWSHMSIAVAKCVKEKVEPRFKALPGPLASLYFTHIDFGTAPIRINKVTVHERLGDSVKLDCYIIWDGNSDIRLKADRVGAFGVRNFKLAGHVSVLLAPLKEKLPVLSAIQYSFINPPTLEIKFTGLTNRAHYSLLDAKLKSLIQDILQEKMVLPNRMVVKVVHAIDFLQTYRPPVGIARVTAIRGNNFKLLNKSAVSPSSLHNKSDVPNVYCNFRLGGKEWKTATAKHCSNPEWVNEACDFLLHDHDQVFWITAWNDHTGKLTSDSHLGGNKIMVSEMLRSGNTITFGMHGDTQKGASLTIRCDLCSLTSNLDSLESNKNENLFSGLLTILVIQAENLPVAKKEASSFVKIKYGSEFEFVTRTVRDSPRLDALNPSTTLSFTCPLLPSSFPARIQLTSSSSTEKTPCWALSF